MSADRGTAFPPWRRDQRRKMSPLSLGKHRSARIHECKLLGGEIGGDQLTLPTWLTADQI